MEPTNLNSSGPVKQDLPPQKSPVLPHPVDKVVSENAMAKFQEQIQNYRERHKENIQQKKKLEQQQIEQRQNLEREQDAQKTIEETNTFLENPQHNAKIRHNYLKERLVYALHSGNVELLKLCCEKGGHYVVTQDNIPGFPPGFTPLMLAASRPIGDPSSLEMLEILLEKHSDVNAVDSRGMMALDYLEESLILVPQLFDQCKALLIKKGSMDYGTHPDLYDKVHEEWKTWQLIHKDEEIEGIDKSHVYRWMFNHILADKHNPHTQNMDYSELTFRKVAQIIKFCTESFTLPSMKYDLERGSDLFDRISFGEVIHKAMRHDDWSLMTLLLEAGAGRKKATFIELFNTLDPRYEIVKSFVKLCDITGRDRDGNTALMLAVSQNKKLHKQELQESISKGDYDANIYDSGNYENNNLNVIKLLFPIFKDHPDLMNAKNTSGKTVFTLAKKSYSKEIKQLFEKT